MATVHPACRGRVQCGSQTSTGPWTGSWKPPPLFPDKLTKQLTTVRAQTSPVLLFSVALVHFCCTAPYTILTLYQITLVLPGCGGKVVYTKYVIPAKEEVYL